MPEISEVRVEDLLRETLRTEAGSLAVRVTAQDVLVRRQAQRLAIRPRGLRLLLVAALLALPVAAAVLIGSQQDEQPSEGYGAVLVRGLVPDEASGTVSDLEVVLAGPSGTESQVVSIPAGRLSGHTYPYSPILSPSGRWLSFLVSTESEPWEGLVILDLQHPEADPLSRLGSSVSGWGPDDTLWRSPNGPIERIDPGLGTVEVVDQALPADLTPWPFERWTLPVAADGSGVVVLNPESLFYDAARQTSLWAVIGPAGVKDADAPFPRLAADSWVRLLDERRGLLRECDSDPNSGSYCAGHAHGTVVATTPDGSESVWRAAPPAGEFVLGASWAADGGLWVLVDRRSADGRTVGLVHVDEAGTETPGPAMAVTPDGGLDIEAMAADDTLILVSWVDEAGYRSVLMEPGFGQSWLHAGQLAGFIGPATDTPWLRHGSELSPGELLPESPPPGQAAYASLPPVSSYLSPLDGAVLLEHEAPALAGPDQPEPVTLGPVALQEGYGVTLVCSGPGDVRYTVHDDFDKAVKHCQDGHAEHFSVPFASGSLTITVEPDSDTAWRLVVYDLPHREPLGRS